MSTETYYFTGIAVYPQHLRVADKRFEESGIYSTGLVLDAKSQAAYDASGIQVSPKQHTLGDYIKFSRKHQQPIKTDLVTFGPPRVIDSEGNDSSALIGEGSVLTCKVQVYDTRKGKGHRLEAVRIDKLVEYKPKPREEGSEAGAIKQMPF